jgi:hypothetical protein
MDRSGITGASIAPRISGSSSRTFLRDAGSRGSIASALPGGFCEAIDCLADRSAIAEMNHGLALQVHRAALTVTGAQPALICINSAE